MKNLLHKLGAVAFLTSSLLFAGCDPEFEEDRTFSAGSLDLSKYVAVGNSLTAGYQDGGLYLEGQRNSYPNILANQFSLVGGGGFTQPLFTEEQKNGSGYLKLTGFSSSGLPTTAPVTTNLAIRGMGADNKTPLYTKFTGEVQNLGVPGIKMVDVTTAGYGYNNPLGFNPFYERLLSDQVAPTGALLPYVNKVESVKATFFTMWLGNNDVLGYATSGGIAAISSETAFQTALDAMVAKLPAQGVIINIPDVTAVPFFTTKATAGIMAQAQAANAKLYITMGDGTVREAKAADYVLLTSTVGTPEAVPGIPQQIPHGFSPFNPLKNQEVLDENEVTAVKTATTSFNAKLRAAATAKNVAFSDMNAYFNAIKAGFSLNGVNYSPAFITGNLFSLDGVHLTPRGYAIVANEIIKAINTKYSSTIPTIDVTLFRAVLIP
ncbi:SGNH/GDSL hydrolase family protein [Nibribacter ruber]|nr:SGNH/GDSL hydrolase family protein [Nibribacter ruber]